MNRLALLALLLLLPIALFSQDKLARLSYGIIDTSSSQKAQVEAIYTWITNNIDYDVTQYQKGNRKHFTPEQVVRRRRALCKGYAELFSEMCRRIGVESYVVNGYSKGFGYLKGSDFLKADHAWNVCYADSSWLMVDATWGSGGLDYDYTFWVKLRKAVTGKAGIRTKLIFIPNPSDVYFAMLPEVAAQTHFPLDSKWQLLPNAVPYGAFVFDSTLTPIPIDFVDKTYKTRVKSVSYNCFSDGVNSIRYNPKNHFDIGYEYYREATNIAKTLSVIPDSALLSKVDTTIRYYDLSLGYIQDFRTLRRDGYSAKKLVQSQINRNTMQSVRGMRRIPTTPNGYYASVDKRYTRVERSYEKAKRSAQAGMNSALAGLPYSFDAPTKPDTSAFAALRKRNAESFTTYTFHLSILENKLPALAAIHGGDTLLNEQIIPHLDSATSRLLTVEHMVENMDEFLFFRHCDTLGRIYALYDTTLAMKVKVRDNLSTCFGEFSLSFMLAEGALKRILRNYERMAKKSGNNDYYSSLAIAVAGKQKQIYQYKAEAVAIMARNSQSWHQLADMQDNELAIFGRRGVVPISNRIAMFYDYIYSRDARMYRNDITLANIIKDAARTNLSLAKKHQRALKKLYQVNKKKKG